MQKKVSIPVLTIVLVIFYTVGLIGMLWEPYRALFLQLSVYNLLLTFILMILGRKKEKGRFVVFLLIAYLIGFAAEYVGTQTGYLFGSYAYGANLGPKFLGVPLVIGLNWGILVVGAASLANYIQLSNTAKAFFGALFMTAFDYILEPFAITNDYWHWFTPDIPILNYISWFLISFLLLIIYFKGKFAEKNPFHATIFIVMAAFFILLTKL